MTEPQRDPVDLVTEALTALRGNRGPRGPRGAGPFGDGPRHGDRNDRDRGHRDGRRGGFPGAWGGPGERLGGPARARLLFRLVASDRALTVSEVAEAIGVDQPRASRLVQQSVELGLVERQSDPDDARRTLIALTDRGRAAATGMRGQARDAVTRGLAALEPQEQQEFARLFAKFAAAWATRP